MPGLFGYDVSADQGVALVQEVLHSPIRFLDTANGYSDGESERRIGAGIAANGGLPEDFVIGTKVDAKGSNYSGARVRESVAESKERLGLDRLPLVHLHDPENHDFDMMTAPGGAVETLVAMRDAGEIGSIGLAGGDTRINARYFDLGVFDVLLVHNRLTLVDRSADALVERAAERGMGVLNAAVYGSGALARQEGPVGKYGYRPPSQPVEEAILGLRRLCAEYGTDIATAALQFSLRDPRVSSSIVGISKPERLEGVLAASATELPQEFWDRVEELCPAPECWLDAD
ncbi:aldo/keto reductase [Georgenia halophila]